MSSLWQFSIASDFWVSSPPIPMISLQTWECWIKWKRFDGFKLRLPTSGVTPTVSHSSDNPRAPPALPHISFPQSPKVSYNTLDVIRILPIFQICSNKQFWNPAPFWRHLRDPWGCKISPNLELTLYAISRNNNGRIDNFRFWSRASWQWITTSFWMLKW